MVINTISGKCKRIHAVSYGHIQITGSSLEIIRVAAEASSEINTRSGENYILILLESRLSLQTNIV